MISSENPISSQKITRHVRLKIDKVIGSFHDGVHRSAMSGGGIEFRGIRPYDPSDRPSQIDWGASARLSGSNLELVSRDYYPEREISVICVVEDSSSMHVPQKKREHAAALSWLFAISAFKYHDLFKFARFSSQEVCATQWVRREDSLLASRHEHFRGSLFFYLLNLAVKNTLLVVISDFGPHWKEEYTQLRRLDLQTQNIRCLFFALDEWAGFTPSSFGATFLDPVSRVTRVLNLGKKGGAHREQMEQKIRFDEISRLIRPLGIPFITVPLLEDPLLGVRRGLLKLGFE